ncbi:MAG TPA: gliding motility-associated C-terminal domain-containing protein [Saprospiraceae bacterium]|nr:gliding motility-associated C-terminal domain-containing protein [Saprospiraceae bacterium]
MYRISKIILLFTFSSTFLIGQNLIPNPGFEECQTCNQAGFKELYIGAGANNPIDWTAATFGTPDFRSESPKTGKHHGGFFVGFAKTEYLVNHFTTPLEPGASYRFSFSTKADDRNLYYAIDQIGVYIQKDLPNYPQAIPLKQLNPQFSTPEFDFIKTNYQSYSFDYVACGGEDHFIVGKFRTLEEGDTLWIGNNRLKNPTDAYIYYLVDDFSMIKVKDAADFFPDEVTKCPGSELKLSFPDSLQPTTILWSDGSREKSFTISNQDSVFVEYTFNANCTPNKEWIKVNQAVEPKVNLDSLYFKCATDSIEIKLDIQGQYKSIEWENGSKELSNKLVQAGVYFVDVYWECGKIEKRFSIGNTGSEFPILNDYPSQICFGDSIFLSVKNSSICKDFVWNNGVSNESTFWVKEPGSYRVRARCSCDTLSVTAKVELDPNCDPLQFPNTIAINGQENNRIFQPYFNTAIKPYIKSYEVKIFNRWGHEVFQSSSISNHWQPDEHAANDSYLYLAKIKFMVNGLEYSRVYNGTVTLLR